MAAQSYFDWTARLFDPTKIFGRPEARDARRSRGEKNRVKK
jgi:hypothetical protein